MNERHSKEIRDHFGSHLIACFDILFPIVSDLTSQLTFEFSTFEQLLLSEHCLSGICYQAGNLSFGIMVCHLPLIIKQEITATFRASCYIPSVNNDVQSLISPGFFSLL